ncbi:Protein of uncharacterised function (DUF554) [Raoultella ornithinolytica]|nr:Protein of uncharacterised function (DUF554) [Raoultella ornithinolytica]
MTSIFGLASLGIGILLVREMRQPAGDGTLHAWSARCLAKPAIWKKAPILWSVSFSSGSRQRAKKRRSLNTSFIQSYVAIIVLFCASGTGIFGANA